jgi:hypothetical protein
VPLVSMYGLRIRSVLELPGTPLIDEGPADLIVRLGERPPGADAWGEAIDTAFYTSEHAPGEAPSLIADRPGDAGMLRLRYAEGIRFHIARAGDEVWCDWRAPMTEADAVIFLLGPVMGSVLRRRGVLALHASAVEIDGGAWAFIGPGGSGKSTLAAAFGRRGRALLTEDVLALRQSGEGWMAAPAYRGIRLWEDSAELFGQGDVLPPLTPTWPKRDLDLARHGLPFASTPTPLRGIVVLDDYLAPGAPPRLDTMPATELLVELIANVYANYMADSAELGRELRELSRLAPAVAGWRMAPGAGALGLSESCSAIESLVNR